MDLYAENILDHYRHPHKKNELSDATVRHEEKNLSCGDTVTIFLKITDNRIQKIGWSGDGCAISQAAMSMLSEVLEGKDVREVLNVSPQDVYKLLGVPIGNRRVKCALLCLHALKNALHAFRNEPAQGWNETVQ